MFTFRLAPAFALLLLVSACGSPSSPKTAAATRLGNPTLTAAATSSPAPTASPAQTSSPSPTASPSPTGWVTYTEPAWGYSISMPADWHLVIAGQQDPQQFKSFSNENVTNAAILTGLEANGMLVKVIVSQLNSGCPGDQPPVGWSASTLPAVAVDIDGQRAVVWGTNEQPVASLWNIQAGTTNGKYCYSFVGLTRNHDAQLKWTPLFEQILSTFSFGALVAPPF